MQLYRNSAVPLSLWLCLLLTVVQLVQPLKLYWISPRQGSTAGGTQVLVVGTGFATDQYTGHNFIFFGDIPCLVQGYTVSPTRLYCVTQPFPGAFEGSSSGWLQARILSKGKQYQSTTSSTRFRYNWIYTPQIWDIIPSFAPINSLIEIGGYRFSSAITDRYTYIYIGNQICDFWNEDNDKQAVYGGRWYNNNYYIKCLIKDRVPGAKNASAFLTGYSGRTWNHSKAMKLDHERKLTMFELYPDIHEVQPHSGGFMGGTLITIKGNGFGVEQSDIVIKVDIDGIPCEVTNHTETEIKCWTQKTSNITSFENDAFNGFKYLGSRGVTYNYFSGLSSHTVDTLYQLPSFPNAPSEVAVFPSFSPSGKYNADHYGARYMAFFTPLYSGRHSFFLNADDTAILYFSEGKHTMNLTEIARVNFHSSWTIATTAYSSARSDTLNLTAGQQYLLVGDMAEGGGADFLRVGVLIHDTEFLNNETAQSVRERQLIQFESHGHYDIQCVYVEINTTTDDWNEGLTFQLEWGTRSSIISHQQLLNDEDIFAKTLLYLLEGICNFYPQNVFYYNDKLYDFESDGSVNNKETSYCGRQSLIVSSQVIIIDPDSEEENGFLSSDYPFLCNAYKIPPGLDSSLIIHIKEFGWITIALTSDTSGGNDWSDAESADEIIPDDTWRYGCSNIHSLILISVSSDLTEFLVNGFGYELNGESEFFIDALSFTSVPLTIQIHLPPSKPYGISVHQLINDTQREWKENDTVLSIIANFEIVPTSCDNDIPLISLSTKDYNNSAVISYGSKRLQNASESIQGTYQLGMEGSWTRPIDYFSEASQIQDALNAMPTIVGSVNVWYRTQALPQDKLGKFCPGRQLVVRFDRVPGDVSLLLINSSNITGHGAGVNVKEIETGGLFLHPIPGHMLQSVESTPQVHVTINNLLASCSGGIPPYDYLTTNITPCGFSFNQSLTPTVTSISPASGSSGDSITIIGDRFSSEISDIFVLFEEIECNVTEATETSIKCILGEGRAGLKTLWLHVLSQSAANTDGIILEYLISILSIDPLTSGTGGGIPVIVTGNGFATNTLEYSSGSGLGYSFSGYKVVTADNCSLWKNEVNIGGKECKINAISSNTIECDVLPGSAGSVDVVVSVKCIDTEVNVNYNSTYSMQFTYNPTLDPTITSITPVSGSGRGGETVVITGTGFPADLGDVTVAIGGSICTVTDVSGSTSLECITSSHSHGSVDVVVTVSNHGIALGNIVYEYELKVTDISKCTGSFLGGQLLIITGNGFSTDERGVDILINSVPCLVKSITDTKMSCVTGSTATTHVITNNIQNPDYGLGYLWDKPDINITVGDSIEWRWTGSAFTALKRIVEVNSNVDNEYNGHGFRSEKAVRGTFIHTFTNPGVFHYIMEGYGSIGFRGRVMVQSHNNLSFPLIVSFNSIKAAFDSTICGQTMMIDESPIYSYLNSETPGIVSISSENPLISPGSNISVAVTGIISISEYNVLTIGGKPCTFSTHSSIVATDAALQLPATNTYTYNSQETIVCTVPDLYPGDYRLLLNVAGRGWAYGNLNDTILEIRAVINEWDTYMNGSVAGGTLLAILVTGIDQYIIGQINVYVGNTPCLVQDINSILGMKSEITCITAVPRDDGYSALVSDNALCYWSLQYDFYNNANEKFSVENNSHFTSEGKLSSVKAMIVGNVLQGEAGISGGLYRDQSAYFSSSYLRVENLSKYSSLGSFSFEMWFKGMSPSGKYVVLASSYESIDKCSKGFLVALNPCNEVEYWLGTGEQVKSYETQNCSINFSICEPHCLDKQLTVIDSGNFDQQMPDGTWHIIKNEEPVLNGKWNHLVFGFEFENGTDQFYGVQKLYVNNKLSELGNVSYQHSNSSDITFGGSNIIHTKHIPELDNEAQVYPFIGYMDEISLFDYMLNAEDVSNHYKYGTTNQQPIVITARYTDGIGEGMAPDVHTPKHEKTFNEMVLEIVLDEIKDETYSVSKQEGIRVKWTGLHGLYQVKFSLYKHCLDTDVEKAWSPPRVNGSVTLWLESGYTHYFIDPVGDNCFHGKKFQISMGKTMIIDWTIGIHSGVNIIEGDSVVFKWNDVVAHNVIEMTDAESVTEQCIFVGENAVEIGKVKREWWSDPTTSAEIFVTDLSVGQHYFVCSVNSHCKLGMRLIVNVASQNSSGTDSPKNINKYFVPWYIPALPYSTLSIVQGESVVFSWSAFHSLHQVTQETFESCNTAVPPLYEWARPSIDNSVEISYLVPGSYYFICSVSGHCDAGMKLMVQVHEGQINPLHTPIRVSCENSYCPYSYSEITAPVLHSVKPSSFKSGDNIRIQIANYDLTSAKDVGESVHDIFTIFIGSHPCSKLLFSNHTEGYNELTCTISTEQEGGYYDVQVHLVNFGYAKPNGSLTLNEYKDSVIGVSVIPTLDGITPTTGSINGGTRLTITGTGFSVTTENIQVQLGSLSCHVVESSKNSIECITPPTGSIPAGSMLPVLVSINQITAITSGHVYTYSMAHTPQVIGVSKSVDVESGDELQIFGNTFGSTTADVSVQLLSEKESFHFNNVPTSVLCSVTSVTPSTMTCIAPNTGAGPYSVVLHVNNLGLSKESSEGASLVVYNLAIYQINPNQSGHGGGLVLNLTGSGYPIREDNNVNNIEITVCKRKCEVVDILSEASLSCSLDVSGANDTSMDTSCDVVMAYNGQSGTLQNFTFNSSLTPIVKSISPDSGGTAGGTYVTITGVGFLPVGVSETDLQEHQLVITLDDALCKWSHDNSPNDTSLVCRTSDHRTTVFAEITVFIEGKGKALVEEGLTYQYVDRWSSEYTWGGHKPPLKGESVYIKEGQTVYLDTNTPVLNLILIEGTMIFEDKQDIHLRAKYIFINNGKLQIGSEDNRFTHNAIVTLHGTVTDPEIPIYGAKVIGIRQGELDIHGRETNTTWTRLQTTAMKNTTILKLQDPVNWLAGDVIVIAPTSREGNETETQTIDYVSNNGFIIHLKRPLAYTHYGITEVFENGDFIDIRAEVGLLSHNVIIEGSRDASSLDSKGADQYGVQIMIHRTGPHPTPIRIQNAEVRYAGQAFRLGRYAIHFHLSGNMSGSYIKNCAIHHSNNRALTAHGVHNLLVEGNVAYDIKGHAFFVEDGIETNNRYLNNFAIYIRSSSSLLNTDQLPAAFWITHPNNAFIGNAAVASRAYGFWYDLDNSPSGPSYTPSVCPNKEVFGTFSSNVAHSNNEFGLRIWETYTPYADGCSSLEYSNAILRDFVTYSNDIHGVEFSVIGNVKMVGFKVADNRDNGIEIQETIGQWEEATIEDSLIVSHTSINTYEPGTGGIRTPNTPGLRISNVTFANFDLPSTACLRACSHCKVFQGGFQVSLEKVYFTGNSSLHKAYFQWEHEVLFHDLDGSLSGISGAWVLPNSNLHPIQYCTKTIPEFSINKNVPGTVCSSDVYFLRVAWNKAEPLVTLQGAFVNVSNEFGSSIVPWTHYRLTHMDGYMVTLPSQYNHLFTWQLPSSYMVDVMSYSAGVYSLRNSDYLIITHEFVQVPDHVNVGGNHYPNEAMVASLDPNFSWYISNTTDAVSYVISGLNATTDISNRLWSYSYEPCPIEGCPQPPDPNNQPLEENQRRWSVTDSWPGNKLPTAGEDVVINSTWRMLLDVSPPPLGTVIIAGEMEFEDVRDYNFRAKTIIIRGPNAHLKIGSEASPFSNTAVITLTGNRNDQAIPLSTNVYVGSKAIGIFGNMTLFGQQKSHSWTTLSKSCFSGESAIYIKESTDWSIGDQIVIASSSYEASEAEIRTITAYDQTSGKLSLNEPLHHNHEVKQFISDTELEKNDINGSWWWTGSKLDLTMSPEVGLLSHNIVIQGSNESSEPLEEYYYGCRILVGEYMTPLHYTYTGTVAIDSVEIRYCGQGGYFSPIDPRYSLVFKNIKNSESYVSRSSIHHSFNTGIGIHTSSGVTLSNNVVYQTTGSSIICGGSDNILEGNLALMTSAIQPNTPSDNHAVDFPATFDINRKNIVRNNAAGGTQRISFRFPGEECDEGKKAVNGENAQFWNNSAHSGLIGLVILGLPSDCSSVSGFTAHHHWDYSVFSSSPSSISISNMKLAIGKIGFNLNIFGPNPVTHLIGHKSIEVKDTLIVGFIPETTCTSSSPTAAIPGVSLNVKSLSAGIMMSSFNKKRSKMDGTSNWHLMKGYPTVDGKSEASGLTFAHFNPPADCAYSVGLITNNPLSPDAVHPLELSNVMKLDVPEENLVFFHDPNPDWIVQEDCVDMDCDGPKHALIRDIDGTFTGISPEMGSIIPFAELRFDNYTSRVPLTWLEFENSLSSPEDVINFRGIYRGNPFITNAKESCTWMNHWNSYHCQGLDHLMLVIESMDDDSETRRISPVALVGSGPVAEFTDLLNGPMDHGWCTYYTCLKRLSTFYSIVSTNIDYHIWMTGSVPASLRFHLLNSNATQAIRVNIWYKDPRRKDVYKNGIFIEPSNTNFLNNGAVTQLDGDYLPSFVTYSGANYFDKETQILTILVKGSDVIEIKTPPVVQVALNVAVSIDDFFIMNLIENLAFVLKITVSRIRVVNIIAEDSTIIAKKKRSVDFSTLNNTITLEFGDPPVTSIDPPDVIPPEVDWADSHGENDNLDIKNETTTVVSSVNPYNEEVPETIEDFTEQYNELAESFTEQLEVYNDALEKVNEVNRLGANVIDLIQTGELDGFSITSAKIILAAPPAIPLAPVTPPDYLNVTNFSVNTTTEAFVPYNSTVFTIPTHMIVSREPSANSGHLIYVAVSMVDINGNPVNSLGHLNSWKCTAMLISPPESLSMLEGQTEEAFVNGIAVFTRLRVDKPSSKLRLAFISTPGSFSVNTSILFSVHEPSTDTDRITIFLVLKGNTSLVIISDQVAIDIQRSLSHTLDIDYSRITSIDYIIVNETHLNLTFDLLDNATTDPPNVPSLQEAIDVLKELVLSMNLTVIVNGSSFKVLNGSLEIISTTKLSDPTIIIVSIATVCSLIILLMLGIAFCAYCCNYRMSKSNKTVPNPVDFQYESDDELQNLRTLQIPKASIIHSGRVTVHHPNSAEMWTDTTQTTTFTEDNQSSSSSGSSTDFDSTAAIEMPRIPRPFRGLPQSIQSRQAKSFASLLNSN